jgi:tetrahydrodipicolinate N-succinyltransferase
VPFARVPLYISIGAVRDEPVAVDGAVVVRPRVVVGATADHRLVDGAHAGRIAGVVRELLADPYRLDGPPFLGGPATNLPFRGHPETDSAQQTLRAEPSEM